ncbi:MAG: transaldolase family protein [Anaerolineae bacterium]|jgi:transaldolase
MALYLDTADVDKARRGASLGFLAGLTTNPALLARAGGEPADVIAALCAAMPGMVFHQVIAAPGPELDAEIERYRAISDRIGFKFPCTLDHLRAVHALAGQGPLCAVTAVFDAAQAYLAAEAGADYAIPYVNRTTRLCGSGPALVADMAAVLKGTGCDILAASIKDPAEAVAALQAGARHLTVSWRVIEEMAAHRLTEMALADFAAAR